MDRKNVNNLQIGGGYSNNELILGPKDLIKLLEVAIEYGKVIIRVPEMEVLDER